MIIAQSITIKKAQDQIGKKVQDYIKDIAIDLSNEMKREAPVHTGRLRDSIQVQETSDGKIYVGTNVEYADNLQYGKPPEQEPDIDALEIWVRRKMKLSKPASWLVASNLQDKIAEEGVEKNPFVTRAIQNVKEKY